MPTYQLDHTPIHLGVHDAVPIKGFNFDGPSFAAYRDGEGDAVGSRLALIETTPTDWTHWERHTLADELVIVLSGRAEFIHRLPEGLVRIPVATGDSVINPAGVWHIADVQQPLRAIYLTPVKGTEHAPREAFD